jgi:predicted transcriptional regulator
MDIVITCETTEFAVFPNQKNIKTLFSINERSLVISFCDKKEKVLDQSEISIEDARKLAKLILNY